MKRKFSIVALILALVMTLGACAPGGDTGKPAEENEAEETVDTDETADGENTAGDVDPKEAFWAKQEELATIEHDGEVIEGGTFRVGLVTDSPFKGIFHSILYQDAFDGDLMSSTMNRPYERGDDFLIISSDAMDIDHDQDEKTTTITLKDEFKWNDGSEVVAEDIWYNYMVIGHKDYTGVRYTDDEMNIIGMEEYRNGETEDIEGVEIVDDKTVKLHFKSFYPSIQWGAGLWLDPIKYDVVKDIPISELETSDPIRKNPMSAGPFVLDRLVEGESAEFVKNPHYWGGEPKIDAVLYEVVSPTNVLSALEAGRFDTVTNIPATITNELDRIEDGYTVYEYPDMYYGYLGFSLGRWNNETNEVEVVEDAKMSDPALRKAMALAIDHESLNEKIYGNTRPPATSVIIPAFVNLHNYEADGYKFNMEEANKMLDDAGYEIGEDGFRKDPNGEDLTIYYAAMEGDEVQENVVQYYLQSWRDGLNLDVELATGRQIEFQLFYELIDNLDPSVGGVNPAEVEDFGEELAEDVETPEESVQIDVFAAAWGVGTNPDPSATYGKNSSFNMSRYTNEDIEDAIERIASEDAFDDDFREKAYKDFDKALYEAASVIPLHYRNAKGIINKRVKKWDASFNLGEENPLFRYSDIELTEENPFPGAQ